jgi:hypothetical protein
VIHQAKAPSNLSSASGPGSDYKIERLVPKTINSKPPNATAFVLPSISHATKLAVALPGA